MGLKKIFLLVKIYKMALSQIDRVSLVCVFFLLCFIALICKEKPEYYPVYKDTFY